MRRARSTCSRQLGATRHDASFIFTSTNKVYGDTPNRLPLVELPTRFELGPGSRIFRRYRRLDEYRCSRYTPCSASRRRPPTCWSRNMGGTSTSRPSASAAAVLPVQTTRGRSYTGSSPTSCAVPSGASHTRSSDTEGLQVRDNVHSSDLVRAFRCVPSRAADGRGLQLRRRAGQQLLDDRGHRDFVRRSLVAR